MKVARNESLPMTDDCSDEAMQYKLTQVPQTSKTMASQKTKRASALRTPSAVNIKSKVSFSDDNKHYKNTQIQTTKNNKNNQSASSLTRNKKEFCPKNTGKENSSSRGTHSSPRKWNLGKRFSLFGSSSTCGYSGRGSLKVNKSRRGKNGYGTLCEYDLLDDAVPSMTSEVDPVMTIFESRNTQRVRFALEGDAPAAGASRCSFAVAKLGSTSSMDGFSKNHGDDREGRFDEKSSNERQRNGSNLKQFMSRTLFGSKSPSTKILLQEEMEREVKELGGGDDSLIWESARTMADNGPEVVHTHNGKAKQSELLLSFTEDPKARAAVTKLLSKARRAEHIHFRYEYAVKCCLKAVNILKRANYPENHPTFVKTVKVMNNAHHVLCSYNNSANIVKMGIRNEDAGELIKALKMYTIAYRIRRDNLSPNHPSLVVLLNMLGSIQIKRGELEEAMQIYELALNESAPVTFSAADDVAEKVEPPIENLLAKSVTLREIGNIHELCGNVDEALQFYHKSLECVAEWRERACQSNAIPTTTADCSNSNCAAEQGPSNLSMAESEDGSIASSTRSTDRPQCAIDTIQPMSLVKDGTDASSSGLEHGEMELVFGNSLRSGSGGTFNPNNAYDKFFPEKQQNDKESNLPSDESSHADMDLALTLHQIAQLYRAQGQYSKSLDAFEVALRGMKTALGKHHPNAAAVLGNIGNLQKEMGDLDAAYMTYQEVLGIESYRLGLSHPDVAITLHNIATIDAARGNYDHSLQLYRKVIGLQKKLFGDDNLQVAVTAACMGDVYEKIGEIENSIESFDEAVRIKSAVLGRHSLDVGRLFHKLGKLSFLQKEYLDADSYAARAILIYRLNKLNEDHQWFIDAKRDAADTNAAIVTGTLDTCEI